MATVSRTLLETQTKEPCLSIDDFNRPRTLLGREAISTLLVHLILLEPGTYSNRPSMGVGLVSRYRYNDEDSLRQLKEDIKEQVGTYLPEFEGVDVNVYMDKRNPEKTTGNEIIIEIAVDGVIYQYETAKQSDNKIGLMDLKI